jgi:hypothetical protein
MCGENLCERQRRVTDEIFFIAKIMLFSHKKSKKLTSAKKKSFFSTLNHYFPYIPYAASTRLSQNKLYFIQKPKLL